MERRKNTTAGALVWTPAPACTSPTCSVISEDVWEDESEEKVKKDDAFVSHMDNNGIIGLSEALENVELGKTDADCNQAWFHTVLAPGEANPSRCEKETPSKEQHCNLSRHQFDTEFSLCDTVDGFKTRTGHEPVKMSKGVSKEENSNKHWMSSGNRSLSGECGARNSMTEHYIYEGEKKKITSKQSFGRHTPFVQPAGDSIHHCPLSESVTAVTAPTLPHLLHFSAEEMAAAAGIDAETFPDMGFTESLPESISSKMSLRSSPRAEKSVKEEQKGLQAAGPIVEKVRKRTQSVKSSPGKISTAGVSSSRKVSKCTPDFSKVESRVRFPKSGYKPPKSRLSCKNEVKSPGASMLFKSPADIVKEVLMDTSDGPPVSPTCNMPSTSAPSLTVPEDFKSWQQATSLIEQLQEDYNRLLTKYAEAENTIDRLRLEAKVNLYSDPLKSSHSVQLGILQDASKFMTSEPSQAQKAEIDSSSPLSGHSCHQSLQVGGQLDNVLLSLANNYLQQLEAYGDNLKKGKLKPSEQKKGLSHLAEGLDSLERGYLLARDEHRRLQQQQEGTKTSKFDPERELEGLIYQCGLYVDELKEQVEEMQQAQHRCEAPPSPLSVLSFVPSEGQSELLHPQTPPVPLLVNPGRAAEVNVNSADGENNKTETETDDDVTLKVFYLKPLTEKQGYVEQDFATIMDDYQSFKELPKIVDHSLTERSLRSTDLGTYMQPGNRRQDGPSQGRGNIEFPAGPHKRKPKSENQDVPPSQSASTQSTTLPAHPPNSCKRSHSSSLNSLVESVASERKSSKLQTVDRRVLSQDRIISPETDSGFVCSESSNLTPAPAAPCPLHQRGSESVLGHQEGLAATQRAGPVSATSSAVSPSHGDMDTGTRGTSNLIPVQPKKSSQRWRRCTFSCFPQHCISQTDESKASSGLESDTASSLSEDGLSDQHADSIHSSQSSSPTLQHYHGDPLRAPSLSQVMNHNDAMQLLQKEVSTLKQRVESLRTKNPVRSHASTQDMYTAHSTSQIRDSPENDRRKKRELMNVTVSKMGLSNLRHEPQISRSTQTNNVHSRRAHLNSDSPNCHPAESPSRVANGYIAASAPSAPLQYMPVYPPPFLVYSLPIYVPTTNWTGRSSGVRKGGEVKRKNTPLHSLDGSLNRAIRAAQQMKHTSRHMARSLASGLHYQEVLTQSYSY